MKIKQSVYEILHPHKKKYLPNIIFNWSIMFLVVTDVFTTILETLPLEERVLQAFIVLENITVILFTVEYILRIWTADLIYTDKKPLNARLKYAFTFMMIVDFIAVVPFYIHFIFPTGVHIFRILRVLRILRLVKVNHYIKTITNVISVLRRKSLQLLISIIIIFMLMLIASILMYTVEHDAQPDVFKSAVSGLWWAVNTISTVGYGDIYPITVLGKVLSAVFSLFNIGLIAVPTGIISAGFIEDIHEKNTETQNRKKKRFCPYCGEQIDE